MCTKANRTLGFLRRNLYQCPQDVKEAAYRGLDPPFWNMAAVIGTPKAWFFNKKSKKFRIGLLGLSNFSEQFRKLINRYKRIGYSLDIMRQTACLVVNPIIVDGYASLFNCTTAVRASESMTTSS